MRYAMTFKCLRCNHIVHHPSVPKDTYQIVDNQSVGTKFCEKCGDDTTQKCTQKGIF